MQAFPDTVARQAYAYNTAASGSDSVITLNAVAGSQHVLDAVYWGYDATPSSGSITIHDTTNNATLLKLPVIESGGQALPIPERGLLCPTAATITITLADGSANSYLSIFYR